MILAEVLGRVWSQRQLDGLRGRPLVRVRELGSGRQSVAVDLVNVDRGRIVLVTSDEAAASAVGDPIVDAAVVALVSDFDSDEVAS